jgi:hypothetical protein
MSAHYDQRTDARTDGGPETARPPISDRLRTLTAGQADEVALGDLIDAAGPGGTAVLLFLFAAAALVPGVAPAFGVAICFLSLAFIARTDTLPLPARLRGRHVSRERLARVLSRMLPGLRWVEARLRPRYRWLVTGVALRSVGVACFVAGLLIVLPIPFGNLPAAACVLCLALGLMAADGLFVLAGLGLFLLALAFDIGLVVLFWDIIADGIAALFARTA